MARANGGNFWFFRHRKRLVSGWDLPAAPDAIDDVAATPDAAGTITLDWTLPDGATSVLIRYNVDQPAAPAETYEGVELYDGDGDGESYDWDSDSIEYGHTYRFSIWAYNDGGYADADTASVTGPFRASAYGPVELHLDARRETGYANGTPIATPAEFSGNTLGLAQATVAKRPTMVTSGINSLPSYGFDDSAHQLWIGADVEVHSASGMSLFALAATDDAGISEYILSKWEDASGRQFRLGKLAGDYVSYITNNPDSGSVYVQGGGDTTGPWSVGAVWTPSEHCTFYTDGALDDTDATMNFASMPGSPSLLRVGGDRHTSSFNWSGQVMIVLAYSSSLDGLPAEKLGAALASIGGK